MVARSPWFVWVLILWGTWTHAQAVPPPKPPEPKLIPEPEIKDEGDRLSLLGLTAAQKMDYTKAENFLRSALAFREKTAGLEHPDTALAVCNLAVVLGFSGQYKEAEALFKRALTIREKTLGPEHPEVANILDKMAFEALQRGDCLVATDLGSRALRLRVNTLGPNHPDVVKSLITLAEIAHYFSKTSSNFRKAEAKRRKPYGIAEDYYQRAIELQRKVRAPEDQRFAQCLHNLAAIYFDQHRYDEADVLMRRYLKLEEKRLGPEHPDLARDFEEAASVRKKAQRDAQGRTEAKELSARARAIRSKANKAESHPSSLASWLGLRP